MADSKVTTQFTPAPVEATTTQFTPTVSAEPPQVEMARGAGMEVPPPTSKANLVRYGIPAGYGIASIFTGGASLLGGAAITALSETLAQEIEKADTSPEYQSFMDFMSDKADSLGHGAVAGALDIMGGVALKGVGKVGSAVAKSIFRSSKLPADVEIAQKMLGTLKPTREGLLHLETPYSASLGQISREEHSWINTIEGIARDAIGGEKIFHRFDKRNIDGITKEYLEPYLEERLRTSDPAAFGEFMEDLLGKMYLKGRPPVAGGAFNPVETYGKYLYKLSDNLLANAPPVNASKARDWLAGHGNQKLASEAWNAINFNDITGEKILPELAESWAQVSPLSVDNVIKQLNRAIRKTSDDSLRKIYQGIRGKLDDSLKASLKQTPDALDAYEAATGYHSEAQILMHNATIDATRRILATAPETVVSFFSGTKARYSRLAALKEALQFSGETGEKIFPGGAQVMQQQWEDGILRPLRKDFLDQVVDAQTQIIDPQKLSNAVSKYTRYGGQYLDTVFGPGGADNLKKVSTTLQAVSAKSHAERIFVGLLQGGQMTRLGLAFMQSAAAAGVGTYSYATGDVKTLAYGSAIIFLGPIAMARVLANPHMIKMLVDGAAAGPLSKQFIDFSRRVVALKTAEETDLRNLNPRALNFYINQTTQPTATAEPPIPQP